MIGINLKIFKNKNVSLIFVSQLVSSVCDKMMSIGLIWYLTKEFGILIVPWFLVASFLPHLLMSFFSTTIINKVGALRSVLISEFFRGAVLIILFGSIKLLNLESNALLVGLFISGFLLGLGGSIFNPAILSLPPKLVSAENVPSLNALIDSSMSISTILGAAFAIVILNIVDLNFLILINAASFFWAGFLQLNLNEITRPLKEKISNERQIIGPLFVLKKYPDIARMLISFLFLNLIFTPLLVMIPWYVINKYSGDSGSLAMIEGSMGLGAFLTGISLTLFNFHVDDERRVKMISIISFLFGVFFFIFAISSATWQGAVILFSIGILSTFLNIQVLTYFQMALNEEEVPAIMTAVNIISAASVPISLSFSGLIFPYVNIPDFAKFSGMLIVLIAFVMPKFLKGSIWKLD
jgi:DHA3 family macrolide efflux protein-like MFS transporter